MTGSGEHKFFVGGLDPKTTADAMRSRFEVFGPLSDSVVMFHPSGASRGFGFIEFESRESYDEVLEVINNEGPEFELEGRMVSVKEADGKGGRRPQRNTDAGSRRPQRNTDREPSPVSRGGRRSSHLGAERRGDSRNRRGAGRQDDQRLVLPRDCRKLFLGGLSYRATQGDIEDAFSKFGEITDAIAMMGRDGKARGFGFVTFAQPQMAANAFRRKVIIDDKPLTIKPADGLGGGLDDDASVGQQQPEPRRRRDRAPAPAVLVPSPDVDPKAFEKDENKVYLKGVPTTVNDDRLTLLFSEFGHVITASAQTERGLGFVTFSSPQGPAKAVRRGSITVDGIDVEINPYVRDKTKRAGGGVGTGPPENYSSRPLKRGREATSPKRREREPDNRRRLRGRSPHAAREQRGRQHHRNDRHDRGETEAQTTSMNSTAGKLFVGGISQESTAEGLRDYFLQFGELTDYVIMKGHRDGHRGFGFVTFEDEEVAAGVLDQPHVLDGNELTVKVADGEKSGKREMEEPDKHKLFIGGVSPSTTSEDLERVFSQYGSLNDVIALKGRGFGYVRFDDPAAAEQALQDEIEISGRIVSVRPCADPPRESARKRERR